MTRAYSEDLRLRVIGAVEAGASCRQAARRYEIGESTAIRWLARWRIGPCRRAGARGCEGPRGAWFDAQPDLDPARLVFIDETGLNTKMARLRGRCRRGERLRMAVPHGHWRTTTFVAGSRLGGLDAAMLIDGAMNGDAFLTYVQRFLVPTLRPGDIVILDNLPMPQERRRPRRHGDGRRRVALPAALLARPESHRVRLLEAEGEPAQSRRPAKAGALERGRRRTPCLQPSRVRPPVHRQRIRGVIGKCSKPRMGALCAAARH